MGQILLFLFCTIVFAVWAAYAQGLTSAQFFLAFLNSLYSPKYNLMLVNHVGTINSYIYLIFLIAFSAIGIKLYRHFKRKDSPKPTTPYPLIIATLYVLILLLGLQTIHYLRYFGQIVQTFSSKNTAEKNSFLFGPLYDFAAFCHQHISGQQSAALITGFDQNTITGRHDYLVLTYYLYPITVPPNPRHVHESLQISDPDNQQPKLLLLFEKENPEKFVPQDFEVIARWGKNSLIAKRNN